MYQKTFVCLCRRTVNLMYAIFNLVHAISDMSNIFKFQNVWRIFTRVRACTDGQLERQTECINTFQLCWKVLKNHYSFWNWFGLVASKIMIHFFQFTFSNAFTINSKINCKTLTLTTTITTIVILTFAEICNVAFFQK